MIVFNHKKFGGAIEYLRRSKRMNQDDLAKKMGVSVKTIRACEHGECNLDVDFVANLMNIFGFSAMNFSQYFDDVGM